MPNYEERVQMLNALGKFLHDPENSNISDEMKAKLSRGIALLAAGSKEVKETEEGNDNNG